MSNFDSLKKALALLGEQIDDFCRRADPGVREIVVRDYIADIRQVEGTHKISDGKLGAEYHSATAREAAARYDQETAELSALIEEGIKDVRPKLAARIQQARILRTEAERIDPDRNPDAYLMASVVDELRLQRTQAWFGEHRDDPAALLAAYRSSDERRDILLIRMIEERHGLREGQVLDESAPAVFGVSRAVQQRQESRVPGWMRDADVTLATQEAAYTQAKARTTPTMANIGAALGAIARRAQ